MSEQETRDPILSEIEGQIAIANNAIVLAQQSLAHLASFVARVNRPKEPAPSDRDPFGDELMDSFDDPLPPTGGRNGRKKVQRR